MATKRPEAALLDTNVLVDATDVKRPRHAAAVELLERRPALVLSAQVAREYLVVATRPPAVNGLGLRMADALDNLAQFRGFARLLPEEKPLLPHLLALLEAVPCEGKNIHDALLVATMRAHRVRVLLTSNPTHFVRFGAFVQVVAPDRA